MKSISDMTDDSQVWIFSAAERLSQAQHDLVLNEIDSFLTGWTAHKEPVDAARQLVENQFLLIAADPSVVPGGCSLDRMFQTVKDIQQSIGVSLLDGSRIYYRDNTATVRSTTRDEFERLVETGEISEDTIVFDNSVDRLSGIREGKWQQRFADSWHAEAFDAVPVGVR